MKRIAALSLAGLGVIAIASGAMANQKNTGCGLGSLIFKDQDGLLSQVCAVTSNGIYGNQTFAISTGTSNCEKATALTSNERINKFVSENMDALAMDIAKGCGEYLSTLAVLMDTPVEQRAELYHTLQASFTDIYTSAAVTHEEVLANIEKVLTRAS